MTRLVPVLQLPLRRVLGQVRVTVRGDRDLTASGQIRSREAAEDILRRRSLAGVRTLLSAGSISSLAGERVLRETADIIVETPRANQANFLAGIGRKRAAVRASGKDRPSVSLLQIADAAGPIVPETVSLSGGLDEAQFSALWSGLPAELLRSQLEGHFATTRFWALTDADCAQLYPQLPKRLREDLTASPAIPRLTSPYIRRELAGAAVADPGFLYIVQVLRISDEDLLPIANTLAACQRDFYLKWVNRILYGSAAQS